MATAVPVGKGTAPAREMTIGEVALWEKTGGRSGSYRRADSHGDLGF